MNFENKIDYYAASRGLGQILSMLIETTAEFDFSNSFIYLFFYRRKNGTQELVVTSRMRARMCACRWRERKRKGG